MLPSPIRNVGCTLVLSTAVSMTGCATLPSWSRFAKLTGEVDSSELIAAVEPTMSIADRSRLRDVEQVAYEDALLIDTELETLGTAGDFTADDVDSDRTDLGQLNFGETLLSGSSMSLSDFEALALTNNPTIGELVATTQKAAGFRQQVGLRANPVIGYQAEQLVNEEADQHTIFISQTIVTADKLERNRRVLNEALRAQLLQLEAQKYRVVTDIRMKFFEALAAQEQANQIRDFLSVVDRGLELAELRKEALEGSQVDVLQAKVQKNEIELALQQAEVRYQAAWRELVALAGSPQMSPVVLNGELPEMQETVDWTNLAATILVSSPEYQAAQARIRQSRANLDRQCVQPIPNVDFELAAGIDTVTNSGLINLQAGIPIPLFNRNQGNIAAARAELTRSSLEAMRIENSIKARVGAVSRDYDSSLAAVRKYADDIMPNAEEGLELAEIAYKAGETSFLQVLVARRTYFDTIIEYISSQSKLAQATAMVDGFVLSGALDAVVDDSGDDSLRGLTLSQQ